MSAAPTLCTTTFEAPKVLLDANVFRGLAASRLDRYQDRLLQMAKLRNPPLLWAAPITFEEIVSHVRPEEANQFGHIREALSWMERLCGNDGIAEDLPWTIVSGTFVTAQHFDRAKLVGMNQVRRAILKARSFGNLRLEVLDQVQQKRDLHFAKRAQHVASYTAVITFARQAPKPRGKWDLPRKMVTAGATLETMRSRHEYEYGPLWGALKPAAEQAHAQREMIAFDLARLTKGRNNPKYNVESHPTDFNDQYLCAYPATGYTLVTEDRAIRQALIFAGCEDPRVVDVGQAVEIAENFLLGRA